MSGRARLKTHGSMGGRSLVPKPVGVCQIQFKVQIHAADSRIVQGNRADLRLSAGMCHVHVAWPECLQKVQLGERQI